MIGISNNAYGNYSTNASFTSPIVWSPESEKFIYEGSVFQAFAVDDSPMHLNKPGERGNYTLESGYSMGRLTEGVSTPISPLSFSRVEIEFFGYGDAKQITDEKLATAFDYVINGIKYGALGSMSTNRDSVIVSRLMTTSSTGIYANNKTSGNIVVSDTFNTAMISDVDAAMLQTQANVCRAIIIHPNQKRALTKLDQFIDASRFGDRSVVATGQIGEYLGIKIIVSNHITTATENSITVYKAIALGDRPFIYAQKRAFEFNFERERLRDRAITASWWEMFGVAILKNDSIIIMTSA